MLQKHTTRASASSARPAPHITPAAAPPSHKPVQAHAGWAAPPASHKQPVLTQWAPLALSAALCLSPLAATTPALAKTVPRESAEGECVVVCARAVT